MPKKTAQPAPPSNIGTVNPQPIVDEMRTSYLDYAMSVIVSRALPDVRDGLKPVHRRILYAMSQMGLKHTAKFRKSAAIVGECFVRDTLIATSKGLIPIQDIAIGDQVYTQNGIQPVEQLYIMPARPLLRITATNGLVNTVTHSQPLKVVNDKLQFVWKKARHIKPGDIIVSRQIYPDIATCVALPKFRDKKIHFTEDFAYLIGQFMSDGYYEKRGPMVGRIGFSSADLPIIERVDRALQEIFDYVGTIETRTKTGCQTMYTLRIQKNEINQYLGDTFALKNINATTKCIPLQIFRSPKNVVSAFLSGLFDGDGSPHASRRQFNYGTVSPKLAEQLLLLVHQLGFYAHCAQSPRKSESLFAGRKIISRHPFFIIEISGKSAISFAETLHFESVRKHERALAMATSQDTRAWNTHINVVPHAATHVFQELSTYHLGSGWYQDTSGNKFRAGIKYPNGTKIRYSSYLRTLPLTREQLDDFGIRTKLHRIGSPLAHHLDIICQNKLVFLTVKDIAPTPKEITYDLQVGTDHEFIANGMVAHNCLGKYHPHGDTSVYDAMTRMAQDFSFRYPIVHGQGNMGSIDGDAPAAMRYTEAKMTTLAEEILADIEKNTVDFVPNYDGVHKEPIVLPSKVPQLLLNGTVGIAVGMATNIPPHNLSELVDATLHLVEDPNASVPDLLEYVKGPDFPTGGIIYGKKDLEAAYSTGRGGIVVRAKADMVEQKDGSYDIVVSEIPFQVNKASLIEKIADLVHEKKIEGIRDLRDESSKGEVRIVMELKKDAYPRKVLNSLFKMTQLQETFHFNTLALVDGIQPRVLNLKMMLEEFLKHREVVVRRRTEFDLGKARERAHILEGLKRAIDKIDAVIALIKKSKDRDQAKVNLMEKFKFTEVQAVAILEMRLQQLANLERQKVEDELKEKRALIKELESVLASRAKMLGIIKDELRELKKNFGDERRTEVVARGVKEFSIEDLVPNEPVIVLMTKDGYLKRVPEDTFRTQARGGKGVMGLTTKEEDEVEFMRSTNTHDDAFFFTNRGRVFQLKIYDIPQASRTAKGQAAVNFLQLAPNEKVTAMLTAGTLEESKHLVMVTRHGLIKKTPLEDFTTVRRSGLIALRLKEGDNLEWVRPSTGTDYVMIVTARGQAIRFSEKDARPMGRNAAGVRGIRLHEKDEVIGMDVVGSEKGPPYDVFVVSEHGLGKRTPLGEYKVQGRGGSGIKTMNVTAKTGAIVSMKITEKNTDEDVVVISSNGQVIRLPFTSVPRLGRATQGVRIMRFKETDDTVASVTLL